MGQLCHFYPHVNVQDNYNSYDTVTVNSLVNL